MPLSDGFILLEIINDSFTHLNYYFVQLIVESILQEFIVYLVLISYAHSKH